MGTNFNERNKGVGERRAGGGVGQEVDKTHTIIQYQLEKLPIRSSHSVPNPYHSGKQTSCTGLD